MIRALLSIACHEYSVAAVAYLTYLVKQWRPLPWIGRWLVGSGLVLHAAALGQEVLAQGGATVGMAQGFSLLAFLLLAIFLILDIAYRAPVLGAFLTPVALTVLIPALLLRGDVVPMEVRRPLLPIHIGIAVLGVAAIAAAAGVGIIYLLMERQMKGKRFGILFSRTPSLQFLDRLNRHLVVGGFIAISVTLVTGAFFGNGSGGFYWQWGSKEIATLVAWGVFGVLLYARLFAGWQGKRVAFLTMAGFGLLLVSFFASFDPGRHSGGFH